MRILNTFEDPRFEVSRDDLVADDFADFAKLHGLSADEAALLQARDSREREPQETQAMLDQLTTIADRLDSVGTSLPRNNILHRYAKALRRIRDYFKTLN